jgi:hypothetical protein
MIMMPYDWPWPSPQVTGHPDFWHPTGASLAEDREQDTALEHELLR